MEFKILVELNNEYDSRALSEAINQIIDYNNAPMNKEKRRELGRRKAVPSNDCERGIFENLLVALQEAKSQPLCYRFNRYMTKIDDDKKDEIYDCVINEIQRIISELK